MKNERQINTVEKFNNIIILNEDDMLVVKGGGNEDRVDILIEE